MRFVPTAISLLLDATGKADWQVAAECGIHPSLISRYRSGQRQPSSRHVSILAAYFDCDPDTIRATPAELGSDQLMRAMELSGPVGLDDPSEWID